MSLSMLLDAIERTLSSTLELGPFRLFQARLQPAHVVRHLERLLERQALVTTGGVIVPHELCVRLNPADEARLTAAGPRVATSIARQVERSVRARGMTPLAPVVVEIEPNPDVPVGRILAEVTPSDPAEADSDAPLVATSRLPVVAPGKGKVLITLPGGETASFSQEVVSIGRSAENDVVIADSQVSRRHAEIRISEGELEIRDLESTNGTWVNGSRVQSMSLSCPARVRIGGADIQIDTPRA